MNTVQSIPLCASVSVTPFFFSCCLGRFFSRALLRRGTGGAQYGNHPACVQQPTTGETAEFEIKNEATNKLGLELIIIHGWGWGWGASLLTCTIKASFAKRKCSSLFSRGQKAERVFSMGAAGFTRVGLVIGCATTRGTFVTRTDTVTLENAGDKSDNFAWWLDKEGHTF